MHLVCTPFIFEVIFCVENYFDFLRLFFKDPPQIPYKTTIKITSQGYLFFEDICCLARLFLKITSKDA